MRLVLERPSQARTPALTDRCVRDKCPDPPVADLLLVTSRGRVAWWGYCEAHLRDRNRLVRDGQVWRQVTDRQEVGRP